MVFARRSSLRAGDGGSSTRRRDDGAQGGADKSRASAETRRQSEAFLANPLASGATAPDAEAVAEAVVFALWSEGVVKGRAIEQARREAGPGLRLDQALTRLRLTEPERVAEALAAALGAPMARGEAFPAAPVMPEALPARFVAEARALPLADDGETLRLAMADPLDEYTLRAIAMKTRRRLDVHVACAETVETEIARLYRGLRRDRPSSLASDADGGTTSAAPRRTLFPANADASPTRPSLAPAPRPARPQAEQRPRPDTDTVARAGDRRDDEPLDLRSAAPAAGASEDWSEAASPPPRRANHWRNQLKDQLQDQLDETRGGGRSDDGRPNAAARLNFVRPRRVTLKDAASRGRIAGGETPRAPRRPVETPQAKPAPAAPSADRAIGEGAQGSVAAEVAAQVAARRAARARGGDADAAAAPRADEAMGEVMGGVMGDGAVRRAPTPIRLEELRGRTAAARSKNSAARRKVLDHVRDMIGQASETEPRPSAPTSRVRARARDWGDLPAGARPRAAGAERPALDADDPRHPVRYQAAAAVRARRGDWRAAAETASGAKDGASAAALASAPMDLAALARSASAREALSDALTAAEGLVLIVGPSGSGKAASLKSLAAHRAGPGASPTRFDTPGADLTVGEGRRVFVGDIRDAESAEAAARAAMSGGLVLASLDAATAAGAAPRLIALGLPPYALASSLRVVLAQRLESEPCTRCAQTGRAVGGGVCPECGGAGVIETARFEQCMLLDDASRALILSRAPEEAFSFAISERGGGPRSAVVAPA